jgi:hypothetical protein
MSSALHVSLSLVGRQHGGGRRPPDRAVSVIVALVLMAVAVTVVGHLAPRSHRGRVERVERVERIEQIERVEM